MNYLSSAASYLPTVPSLASSLYSTGADLAGRVTSATKYYLTPSAEATPPTADTLEEIGPSYQDLFMLLSLMKLHLDRGDLDAFRGLWNQLEGYQGLWTEEMKTHLNLLMDGQCLDILLDPRNTLASQVFHRKVSECQCAAWDLAEITPLTAKNLYLDIFGHLVQLEFYLNRKSYHVFQSYVRKLDAYQGMWTEEMNQHLDLVRDYGLLTKAPNLEEAALLKQKLNRCMAVICQAL